MRKPLVIAVAQPLVVSHDVAGNARRHAEMVRAANARVVVFPELSLTGYEFEADAVSPEDDRLTPIVEACRATGSLVLAGAPVAGESGQRHIAMLVIDGSNTAVAYRKMWLGSAELNHFTPGDAPSVMEVDGWRLGLAICKDTGVADHATATAALGIDVYVAGALEAAADDAEQPVRARRVAREHGMWVAIAGFAGAAGEGYERAAGGSGIWRPDGSVAAQAGSAVGEVAVATLV
jgi:predicted amidohydrolase